MLAITARPVIKMEAGPIGLPGLDVWSPVVGEDAIDNARVRAPIPHRPGAEKIALGAADRGDAVTEYVQDV